MDKDFYSIKEFAAKVGVSDSTIRRAIKNCRLAIIRIGSTPKSAIRISHTELERIAHIELQKYARDMIERELK